MILTSLVSVIFILLLVLLLVAIIFNTRTGMKYRKELAKQLDQLRLGKMLTALGIDIDSYLSSEHAAEIRHQIARCSACANTEECETHLAEGTVDSGSIDYCNNKASLQKIAERLKH